MHTKLTVLLALVCCVIAAAGCTSPKNTAYQDEATAVADFDDCVTLQARFDGWYNNRRDFDIGVATGSMEADDAQMTKVGCYTK